MSEYNPYLPQSRVLPGSPAREHNFQHDFARDVGFCRTEQLANLQDSDLTNTIHSCFHPSRFSNIVRYQDLDQVLRLASHFLEVLLPEFYTILCTTPERNRMTGTDGRPIERFVEPPMQLNAQQDFLVREQLELLACSVDYGLDISQDPTTLVAATCCAVPNDDAVARAIRRGMCSTISLNHAYYTRYVYSYYERKNDLVRYNFYCLEMACSVVHELAHAAANLRCNQYEQRPHYFVGHTAKTSEEGFEVESKLFGGIIVGKGAYQYNKSYVYADGRPSEISWPIVLANWPDAYTTLPAYSITTAENLVDPSKMNIDEVFNAFEEAKDAKYAQVLQSTGMAPEVIVPAVLPAYAIQWNTDFLHWHQMFQDSFWDVKVRSMGPRAAMWPVQKRGIRWQLRPVGPRIVTDTDNSASVPEGYYVQFTGLVRLKGSEQADLQDLHGHLFKSESLAHAPRNS
ncbi:hypothetical protein DOTSEDRAFT_36352 [Dothistroma septosporum NZE10]|uniref:Uncharacterized protein n=1 Tax=Dothistroma septosporum (strain NZE10 / CBS 128990) TaxID=675120 RepID=N1PK52_DOTSN|nr:hypothetical protein DOTSEDRAFT_36352 [Dothistroma septosporum NZE10]